MTATATPSLLTIEHQETKSMIVPLDYIDVAEMPESDVRWLADDIARTGLLTLPTLIRYTNGRQQIRYAIAAGKRRVAAMRLLGRTEVKAEVRERDETTSEEQHLIALVENTRRRENPMAELDAIEGLMKNGQLDEKGVAKRIGKPTSWVTGRRALGQLITPLADALRLGHMTFSTAMQAVKLSHAEQKAVVRRAEARQATQNVPATSPLTITGDDVSGVLNKGAIDPARLFDVDLRQAMPTEAVTDSLDAADALVGRLLDRYKAQADVVERLNLAKQWLEEALAVANEPEAANG